MQSYYCLRFKSQAQWDALAAEFGVLTTPGAAVDVIGALAYDEDYLGVKSPYFHVNLALEGDRLPEKLMAFVVKPQRIKRTFNGAGMHEVIDKGDYAKTPDEKILGPEVTAKQLEGLKSEPLIIKQPKNG